MPKAIRHQEGPCHECGSYSWNVTRISLNNRSRDFNLCNKCDLQLYYLLQSFLSGRRNSGVVKE